MDVSSGGIFADTTLTPEDAQAFAAVNQSFQLCQLANPISKRTHYARIKNGALAKRITFYQDHSIVTFSHKLIPTRRPQIGGAYFSRLAVVRPAGTLLAPFNKRPG